MLKKGKLITILLLAVSMSVALFGCGKSGMGNSETGEKKYSIVCTIFPEYDWVCQILGDKKDDFDITLLLDSGVDLHSYQPTAQDISKIAGCDMFVYVGGESDKWVEDALKESSNTDMQVVSLMDTLGSSVKEEELIEGMEGEEEEALEEEIEYDEHVWLSLKSAGELVGIITDAIKLIDAENADIYQSNCDAYLDTLSSLDGEYKKVVDEASFDTLLFGDRFPFRYMTDDYGLKYYAAFPGCSAETEASFDTIIFLSEKVDELGLSSVMVLDNSDDKIAKTIIDNTKEKNQEICILNSMQSVTTKDIENGVSYISIMEDNLEVLKKALN